MKNYGIVETIGKYDVENTKWRKPLSKYEEGRSFAFSTYDIIKNNDSNEFHYIIIGRGTRLENHSNDYTKITDKQAYLDNVVNYLKTSSNNYVVKMFFMDSDAPINEQSKIVAEYIDNLAYDINAKTINYLGLSKCGSMGIYIPKYFKNSISYKKTNIYTIAPVLEGNRMASPLLIEEDFKKIITSKLGNNKLSNLVVNTFLNIYNNANSNSHMDYDIGISCGIPDSRKKLYDSSFMKDMFSSDNIEALKKVSLYKNFITGIDEKTLKESIRTGNFYGIGLCILDDVIFNKTSDGFVPVKSQHLPEKYIDTKSHKLESAHHDVMSIKRVMNEICYVVDDTINEQKEMIKVKNRLK